MRYDRCLSIQPRLCCVTSTSKFHKTRARMNRISALARLTVQSASVPHSKSLGDTHFNPIQLRGPYENGWNPSRRSVENSEVLLSASHRSGMNSSARLKLASLRYMTRCGMPTIVYDSYQQEALPQIYTLCQLTFPGIKSPRIQFPSGGVVRHKAFGPGGWYRNVSSMTAAR